MLQEHHPLDKVQVGVDDFFLLGSLNVFKEVFHLYELLGLSSGVDGHTEVLLDVGDLLLDPVLLINEHVLVDALQDLVDELFTDSNEGVVELVALNQEHGHSDLEGALGLNLLDGLVVLVDLSKEFFPLEGFLVQEFVDSSIFMEQELEVLVDSGGLLSCRKVLIKDFFDLILGVLDHAVVLSHHDVPQVGLVGVGDLGVGTRDLVDSLSDHKRHDVDEFLTDGSKLELEVNLRLVLDLKS